MAISYRKDEKLDNLFARFAKLPDELDSDLEKGDDKENGPIESKNPKEESNR